MGATFSKRAWVSSYLDVRLTMAAESLDLVTLLTVSPAITLI